MIASRVVSCFHSAPKSHPRLFKAHSTSNAGGYHGPVTTVPNQVDWSLNSPSLYCLLSMNIALLICHVAQRIQAKGNRKMSHLTEQGHILEDPSPNSAAIHVIVIRGPLVSNVPGTTVPMLQDYLEQPSGSCQRAALMSHFAGTSQ